ncbi:hypothetical protein B0F90DRAFT_964580 [Multifurca ochricompacta]|uniref:Tetratricopeptide SHNi-TPR domain-containing protein n=1 Tax=Multifurca ochricompacta TaxID=376703 RepID=A0AAD4QPY1_9AGAM|nr:hypothetical protein B0F90DRAFT_964580 [Multifurca ochricompacta]
MSAQQQPQSTTNPPATLNDALDHAKRAFALRKYESAVEHYATALELLSNTHGEDAPEMADVYFAYGKALLENAIVQNSVLGKDQQPQDGATAEEPAPNGNKILSFSGDVEDEEDDPAVDLFAEAAKSNVEEGEEGDDDGEGDEGEDEAEPEDDFNAAWEVLELARAIYEKRMDGDDEVRLKVADTFIALGDISLETEKFDQAINDYSSGLALKTELLPLSSRQLAEAHYKLSIALDLTAGRLADAIYHAQRALESIEGRLTELQAGLTASLPEPSDEKGKGKGKQVVLVPEELVQNWSKTQIEVEIKELGELKQDLALKVDELKSAPNDERDGGLSAPELVQRALDRELNAAPVVRQDLPVNDLTSMVVKKKKKAPVLDASSVAEKRKAEDEEAQTPLDKKARLQDNSTP